MEPKDSQFPLTASMDADTTIMNDSELSRSSAVLQDHSPVREPLIIEDYVEEHPRSQTHATATSSSSQKEPIISPSTPQAQLTPSAFWMNYVEENKASLGAREDSHYNLVVFCHGNNGDEYDWMEVIKLFTDSMRAKCLGERLTTHIRDYDKNVLWYYLVSTANRRNTKVGVKKGGMKLADEILSHVRAEFKEEGEYKKKVRLYLIGHSLGGLFMRSAVKFLSESPEWKDGTIFPASFTTYNSPHLGVKFSRRSFSALVKRAFYRFYKHFLDRTGIDLLGASVDFRNLGDLQHTLELRKFSHRTTFALVMYDSIVPYSTANINPDNLIPNFLDPTQPNYLPLDQPPRFEITRFAGFNHPAYRHILKRDSSEHLEGYEVELERTIAKASENSRSIQFDNQDIIEYQKSVLLNTHAIGWRRVDYIFLAGTPWNNFTMHGIPLAFHKLLGDEQILVPARVFVKDVMFEMLWKDRMMIPGIFPDEVASQAFSDLSIEISTV